MKSTSLTTFGSQQHVKRKIRLTLTALLLVYSFFRLSDEVSAVTSPPTQSLHWRTQVKAVGWYLRMVTSEFSDNNFYFLKILF